MTSISFLKWKHKIGEKINPNDPRIYSLRGNGKYSSRGLQAAFKRCLHLAGINTYHSIHHMRHTYASCLLVSSNNNLRLVQKQMGHSSIATTQVYLHIFEQEIETAIERLF